MRSILNFLAVLRRMIVGTSPSRRLMFHRRAVPGIPCGIPSRFLGGKIFLMDCGLATGPLGLVPRSGRAAVVWAITGNEPRARIIERQNRVTSERRMVVCSILGSKMSSRVQFSVEREVMVGETTF